MREQELNEELARTRRVLPSVILIVVRLKLIYFLQTPKLSRFDRSRGRTSVVPVATRDLSRAQLVEEVNFCSGVHFIETLLVDSIFGVRFGIHT